MLPIISKDPFLSNMLEEWLSDQFGFSERLILLFNPHDVTWKLFLIEIGEH